MLRGRFEQLENEETSIKPLCLGSRYILYGLSHTSKSSNAFCLYLEVYEKNWFYFEQ